MSKLQDLYREHGQSPWLDNLERGWITGGELARWVERGVRGITSNPTIFARAIASSDDYDRQFGELVAGGRSVQDSYWDMVRSDVGDALAILAPVHDDSGGEDGFVSLELAPDLAHDTEGSIAAARRLHVEIDRSNLYVKIPGTAPGVRAVKAMIAEARSINVTLLFGLDRYGEVIDAYLGGLEELALAGGDLASVNSVASFFVSRFDTEVDRRLGAIGSDVALGLRGKAAVANAQLAYQLFVQRFAGERWEALAAQGAKVQRPLWASTSTKNPDYLDTMYVDSLIGPGTVNTMPEATLADFEDHGTVARTVDAHPGEARAILDRISEVGVDLDDVTRTLEDEGVASFAKSFDELLTGLERKADALSR